MFFSNFNIFENSSGEIVERTKAKLFSKHSSADEDDEAKNWRQNESSQNKVRSDRNFEIQARDCRDVSGSTNVRSLIYFFETNSLLLEEQTFSM